MYLRRRILRQRLLWSLVVGLALGYVTTPADAGVIGFPVPHLQPLQLGIGLVGDSFQEDLQNTGDATATTGRALMTVSLGLTRWSEIFARFGVAEFNIDEALFRGGFDLAFGGGLRLRLFTVPLGSFGITGQYLRFTSDDDSLGGKVEGKWEEWDVTIGFGTRQFGIFTFYTGMGYHHSDITLDTQGASARTTLESEQPFRLLIGARILPLIDFPLGNFLVYVEARLIGETPQFTLGVEYAF